MSDAADIIVLIQIIILLIIIVLTWIYALPIIFIQRFHTVTNILTCNVCLVSCFCSLHWTIYYVFYGFYPTIFNKYATSSTIVVYFQTMVNCLVIYAFLMVTINRFFLIVYSNKRLFKSRTWLFISLIIQWLVAIILPLPYFARSFENCMNSHIIPFWFRVYRLFIMVILPSILNGFFNLFIFIKVRLSTQRLTGRIMKISTINSNEKCLNARDICLLKHMLFLHVVFVIGWGPFSLLTIMKLYVEIPSSVGLFLQLLTGLSLLINILDLFLFNHELRQYFKEEFLLKISLRYFFIKK